MQNNLTKKEINNLYNGAKKYDIKELKTKANLFSFSKISSVIILAATLEEVMPHLLNPVATYTLGVCSEYLHI